MKTRLHLVLDEEEKERFRRRAEQEGVSLSEWLRDAARDRLAGTEPHLLDTIERLRAFFAACDARESGAEPDWEEHRAVIERSRGSGAADA